jgi:hypothetical protein
MNSESISPSLKDGNEPSQTLLLIIFSYVQTLIERNEAEIRETVGADGKPFTAIIFSNTSFKKMVQELEKLKSVGESVGEP